MENYNQFALEYAKKTAKQETETRAHFYSLLPNLKGQLLLDVGCGSGHDAEYYLKHGAQVYGLDISEKEIEMAKKLSCGEFTVGNMDTLPYSSNTFDIVTSVYALQASENIQKVLLEMTRVAKPGAIIIILTKHPFRNLLESHINDGNSDYYSKRNVTSYIFNKAIKLQEPGHTLMEYFSPLVLERTNLEIIEEHSDFPASEQVIPGLNYPTYMIIKYKKKII